MNSKLSILTPCSPTSLCYINEAEASVEELRAKASFPVEWVVCLDDATMPPPHLSCEVSTATPEKWGVAAARNQALVNCTGEYIVPLDADDILKPDGVIKIVDFLATNDKYGWASGNRLYVDETKTPHWMATNSEWKIGSLGDSWTSPFPFHPNCLVVRTNIALTVGGWPALPTNEDLAFVLALNQTSAGFSLTEVLLLYRRHNRQTISSPIYLENKELAFNYIQRIENTRRMNKGKKKIKSPIIHRLKEQTK